MDRGVDRFEHLLRCLEEARLADEDVHRRSCSLSERIASHDLLVRLRAEIAEVRLEIAPKLVETPDLHAVGTRRGGAIPSAALDRNGR